MALAEEKRLSEQVLELTEDCSDPDCDTCRVLNAAARACDLIDSLGLDEDHVVNEWTDDARGEQDQVYREVTS